MNLEKYIIDKTITFLKELKEDIKNIKGGEAPVTTIEPTQETVISFDVPAKGWTNRPLTLGNLKMISVTVEVEPTEGIDLVIGTSNKEVKQYKELVTSTRFNPHNIIDNYDGIAKGYVGLGVPYSSKKYKIQINIDLLAQTYQSFSNGVPISKPVKLRNPAENITHLCIRSSHDVKILDVKAGVGKINPIVTPTPKPVTNKSNMLIKDIYSPKQTTDKEEFRAK